MEENSLEFCNISPDDTNFCSEDQAGSSFLYHDEDVDDILRSILNQHCIDDKIADVNYYSIDDFNVNMSDFLNDNSFFLLQTNIRSISKNFTAFKLFISSLIRKPCCICISETWIKPNIACLYDLTDYKQILCPRSAGKGGGVAIFINTKYDFEIINLSSFLNLKLFECVAIEVCCDSDKCNHVIVSVYRPPNSNLDNCISEFLDLLDFLAKKFHNRKIVISGDTNFNLLKVNDNPKIKDFINNLKMYNFIPVINKPTRITNTTSTLIDNSFINFYEQSWKSGIIYENYSDHLPTFLIFPFSKDSLKSDPTVTNLQFRKFSAANYEAFYTILRDTNWPKALNINTTSSNNDVLCNSAKTKFNEFLIKFENIFNKAFPKTTTTKPKSDKLRLKNPWMTQELINCCKIKSRMYKIYRRYDNVVSHTKYKLYSKFLKNKIKYAEKSYYHKIFVNGSSSTKQMWQNINLILNPNATQIVNSEFVINDEMCKDLNTITNSFNVFFTQIGTNLAQVIPDGHGNIFDSMGVPTRESIIFYPTDNFEIKSVIASLKNSSSAGPDDIPSSVIKAASPFICEILAYLINSSFTHGFFPDALKIAKVIPVYKSGDKTNIANYRPISILNGFSKIIERIICTRLNSFFDRFRVLSDGQFGFRKGHSTFMPLAIFTNKISEAKDNGSFAIATYIDLMKAFDTINHNILLKKLEFYGIRGSPLNVLGDYLMNRSQYVLFNNKISHCQNITTGVPQGSVLGPLLFLIYINDICKLSPDLDLYLFADDTNALFIDKSLPNLIKKVNIGLSKLNDWFILNKLSLNASKTKYMLFGSNKIKFDYCISINNVPIDKVSYCTFLGVAIDDQLNWKKHIDSICSKLSSAIGVIFKIRYKIDTKTALLLYNALIGSHLAYCNLIWGYGYRSSLNAIFTLQKRALKICLFLPKKTNTCYVFDAANKLTIFEINEFTVLSFVYSVINHLLPHVLQDFYIRVTDVHSYGSRRYLNIHTAHSSSNIRRFSPAVRGAALWNCLPVLIKQSVSSFAFSRLLKNHIVERRTVGCVT